MSARTQDRHWTGFRGSSSPKMVNIWFVTPITRYLTLHRVIVCPGHARAVSTPYRSGRRVRWLKCPLQPDEKQKNIVTDLTSAAGCLFAGAGQKVHVIDTEEDLAAPA